MNTTELDRLIELADSAGLPADDELDGVRGYWLMLADGTKAFVGEREAGVALAEWDESEHPREPRGSDKGGEFKARLRAEYDNGNRYSVSRQRAHDISYFKTAEEAARFYEDEGIDAFRIGRLEVGRITGEIMDSPVEPDFLENTAKQAARQPWQMMATEYDKYVSQLQERQRRGLRGAGYGLLNPNRDALAASDELARIKGGYPHERHIREALSKGKPVPPEVLADYPDLQAKYGKGDTDLADISREAHIICDHPEDDQDEHQAEAEDGSRHSFKVCTRCGKVHNWSEIGDKIGRDAPGGEVELSEDHGLMSRAAAFFLNLVGLTDRAAEVELALPVLAPGDKWVTLKPHGDASADYVRVVIHPHKDGTASVVWAGGRKGLEHLRLSRVGGKTTKERRDTQRATRQRNKEAWENLAPGEREAAEKKLADIRGKLTGADEKIKALIEQKIKMPLQAPPSEAVSDIAPAPEAKPKKEGKFVEKPPPQATGPAHELMADLESTLAESIASRVTGDEPIADPLQAYAQQHGLSKEAKAAIHGLSKEDTLEVYKAIQEYRETRKQAREMAGKPDATFQMETTPAWYEDPDELTQAALQEHQNTVRYHANTAFWKRVDASGIGVYNYHRDGAQASLGAIAAPYIGSDAVPLALVETLGVQATAHVIAGVISQKHDAEKVAEKIVDQLEGGETRRTEQVVAEAMKAADDAEAEKVTMRGLKSDGALTDVTVAAEIGRRTIRAQQQLGIAAGSLEAASALVEGLRNPIQDQLELDGGTNLVALQAHMDSLGLERSDYKYRKGDDGRLVVAIPRESFEKLLSPAEGQGWKRDAHVAAVKRGEMNTQGWLPPGIVTKWTNPDGSKGELHGDPTPGNKEGVAGEIADSQQSGIRFIESQKKAILNFGVGIGKTLTAAGAIADLHAQGKVNRVYFVVPSRLRDETTAGIKSLFPDMDVVNLAGGPEERRKELESDHLVYVIGHDTMRLDREAMAAKTPDMIVADEFHELITPGEGKASQRGGVFAGMDAPYKVAMTGTVIRNDLSELYKAARWIGSTDIGDMKQFKAKFGTIGLGTMAFEDAQVEALRRELDPVMFTQELNIPVKVERQENEVEMSPQQMGQYKFEEQQYLDDRHADDPKKRRAAAGNREYRHYQTLRDKGAANNPLAGRLLDIAKETGEQRGIVFCRYLPAVDTIMKALPTGTALAYQGETNRKDRQKVKAAFNQGAIVEGVRVAYDGGEGVVTKISRKGGKAVYSVQGDGGNTEQVGEDQDVRSLLKFIVATKAGSTGLNLQGGGAFSVNYDLADTPAEMDQREGRVARRGQKREKVTTYTLVADAPSDLNAKVRLTRKRKLMEAPGEPTDTADSIDDTMTAARVMKYGKEEPEEAAVGLAEWDESEHPRAGKGTTGKYRGGEFVPKASGGVLEDFAYEVVDLDIGRQIRGKAEENIQSVKAQIDKLSDESEALWERLIALTEERGQLGRMESRTSDQEARLAEIKKKQVELENGLDPFQEKIRQLYIQRNQTLHSLLELPIGRQEFVIESGATPNAEKAIKVVGDLVKGTVLNANPASIVIRPFKPDEQATLAAGRRGHYEPWTGNIVVPPDSGVWVYVHEIGHHLENKVPGWSEACGSFWSHRYRQAIERGDGTNQAKKLRDITDNPAYTEDELAMPDKFLDPYMGKIYPKDTEILSMGLQFLYADPEYFMRQDPEMFDWIVGLIRGGPIWIKRSS